MNINKLLNDLLGLFGARLMRTSTYERLSADSARKYLLQHACPKGNPNLKFHLPKFEVTEEDLRITQRVVEAFHVAREKESSLTLLERPKNDLWEKIKNESQTYFLSLLNKRDIPRITEVLVNGLHHRISYGLCEDKNQLTYERASSPEEAPALATFIADRFISLAEALGVIYAEFPEWGPWGKNIYLDLSDIYEEVEQALGLRLAIPECFGLYGIRAGKYTIYHMTPSHVYTAWRILEILHGKKDSRILEIGGGYGVCAYYRFQQPLKRYTIIDLPIINLLQGFFLIKTCGADNVYLYGEKNKERKIHVLPYWMIAEMPDKSFDLTLSQISLTEIDKKIAQDYVQEIARTTMQYFLSINQEGASGVGYKRFQHNIVPELVLVHGCFKRRYRFPFWMRRGVIEELYEISS